MEEWEHSNVSQSYTKRVLKVYHCILQAYLSILKACECFKAYEYILGTYVCIWNVDDHRYIASYNVKKNI